VTEAPRRATPADRDTASNPVNVPLYQRYGFEPLGSFRLADPGPEVVTMWRPARPTHTSRG
jgi:hypothetical protein